MTIWSWLRPVARPTAIVLGLAIGVGGCTALPGDGPWMGGAQANSSEALPFDVIDLTPTTVVAYRQPESPDRPTSIASNLSAAVRISIAPGDSLKVRIFERYGGNIFPTIQGHGRRSRRPARGRGRHDQDTRRGGRAGGGPRSEPGRAAHHPATRQQGAGARGHRRLRFAPHPDRDGVGRRQEARALVDSRRHPHRGRCHQHGGRPVRRQPVGRAGEPARSGGAAPGSGDPEGTVFRSARRRRHPRAERRRDRRPIQSRAFIPSWARS